MYLIALGANLPSAAGSPCETLEAALEALRAMGITIVRRSSWYRTPAFPAGSGPDYVNGVAEIETPLGPAGVLAALHSVEQDLGRCRSERWEARACDLDLLASDDRILPDVETVGGWMALPPDQQLWQVPPGLILPHPRLHERGFVLAPLNDVAPDWVHPLLGLSARLMLAALPPEALEGVVRL